MATPEPSPCPFCGHAVIWCHRGPFGAVKKTKRPYKRVTALMRYKNRGRTPMKVVLLLDGSWCRVWCKGCKAFILKTIIYQTPVEAGQERAIRATVISAWNRRDGADAGTASLLPCPCCGNNDVTIKSRSYDRDIKDVTPKQYKRPPVKHDVPMVSCVQCGLTAIAIRWELTPAAAEEVAHSLVRDFDAAMTSTPTDPIDAWNRRPGTKPE